MLRIGSFAGSLDHAPVGEGDAHLAAVAGVRLLSVASMKKIAFTSEW